MTQVHHQYALKTGTMVQEYRIVEVLGTGSFGIVYKAENKYFPEIVALKEFLPIDLACRSQKDSYVKPLSSDNQEAYQWARDRFLQEAKTLWELGNPDQHPNIVKVRQFIEANDTAYMVMDFEEGQPLDEILEDCGTLEEKEIKIILDALLDGLKRIHGASIWHRDIKPSNILLRPDRSPVLIDFGAARKDITGSDRSTIAVFSPVYAAIEQICPVGDQGPWTDIYSLGATLYRMVTGTPPISAVERMQGDAYIPAADSVKQVFSPALLSAIDAALGLYPQDRPQSISQWQESAGLKIIEKKEATVFRPVSKAIAPPDRVEVKPSKKLVNLSGLINTKKNLNFLIPVAILIIVISTAFWRFKLLPSFDNTTITPSNRNTEDQRIKPTDTKAESPPRATLEMPLEAKLDKMKTEIDISSFPANANVFLNGKYYGKTPFKTKMPTGNYSISLRLDEYFEWKADLLLEAKANIPLRVSMLKK